MPRTAIPEHEYFCKPRPDADEARIETYRLPRYAENGVTQVGSVEVVRCMECGGATYDGVPSSRLERS